MLSCLSTDCTKLNNISMGNWKDVFVSNLDELLVQDAKGADKMMIFDTFLFGKLHQN